VTEDSLKYLEMLQGAINRVAANSFLLKGWSVTLATAVLALVAKDSSPRLAVIAVLPCASFWLLDAYYLGIERELRALFERAVAAERPSFVMAPGRLASSAWLRSLWSRSIVAVHLPLSVIVIVVAIYGIVR